MLMNSLRKECTMNRTWKIVLVILAALVLLSGAFAGGALTGYLVGRQQAAPTPATTEKPTAPHEQPTTPTAPADREQLFAPFWEAWDLVHTYFVDQPVDDVQLMRGAIRGMLQSLGDPHTSYMDPDEYKEATTMLEGQYEGIGAWVDTSSRGTWTA